jgi:hypothetical protein
MYGLTGLPRAAAYIAERVASAAYENGSEPVSATLTPAAPSSAVSQSCGASERASLARRMREARAELRSATERDYVQAIDRWLDGGEWKGADRYLTTGRGLRVRLVEEGDSLALDGVPIVTRSPIRLPDLPAGTRTSARLEARALAAVAVRGDAGGYDGKPRKARKGVQLVWNGLSYVQLPPQP